MDAPQGSDLSRVERLTTHEVLALARISRATLWRRVASGRLPPPIDFGRQALFSRVAVVAALALEATATSRTLETERRLEALRRRRTEKA